MAFKTIIDSSNNQVVDATNSIIVSRLDNMTILGDTTFANNDILRIKDGVDDEWFEVENASSAPTYEIWRDKASTYTANTCPSWKKGTAVVNFGASGEGLIYMTASEANSPHVDVVTHAGAPWTTLTTRMRMGNVNGFLGAVTDLYGIYIGETNNYLKYDPTNGLQIKGLITATSGSSGLGIVTFVQASAPTALAVGDLWADSDDSNKLYRASAVGSGSWVLVRDLAATTLDTWRHSSDTTKIDGGDIYTGTVTANKISVGQLDAVSANTGTLTVDESISVGVGRIVIDGVNNIIKVYDDSSNLRVELGDLP